MYEPTISPLMPTAHPTMIGSIDWLGLPFVFEIDATHIAALDDAQLRELIRRLCAAELRRHGLPLSALAFGGDQDAPDGGIDGRVTLPAGSPPLDFIPKPQTGFQAKRTNITAGKVRDAMQLKGTLYPSIRALGASGGAYVIVSGKASATDSDFTGRINAMKAAMGDAQAPLLDFYDGPRLAGWVNDHPGVALWLRQVLGKPLSGWKPWGNWSNLSAETEGTFLKDGKALITDSRHPDHRLDAVGGIESLRRILEKPGGIVRLIGLSGTGKTRLAQALFKEEVGSDPLPEDRAVYTDMGESPKPSPQELIPHLAALGRPVVLVIDNCPPSTHKSLADQMGEAGGRISLLTIEYDVSDGDAEGTEVFRLDTASSDVIEQLLAARHPQLSQLDRRRITELAGANSRLALAMADAAPRGSLSALKDGELFKRLFWQRQHHDPQLQRAAEICALVYSFDVEKRDGAKAELPILAGLAGMDVEDLYRHVATLLRRQLVQRRGDWRAVLPHVLANRLAQWALENTSLSRIVPALTHHPRLRTSFARRLGFLDRSAEARSIVTPWLGPDGWLGDALAMDGEDWRLVHLLAPVAPDRVLAMIQRGLASPEADRLLRASNWQRSDAIHILSALAYESELFEPSALALARFLAARPDNDNQNTAIRALTLLFQVNYSGTMADLDQRLRVLDQLLADPALHSAARHALDAMLKASRFDVPQRLEFGGRSRSWGWYPGSDENLRRWYAEAFARLEAQTTAEPDDWGRTVLANHFRDLWRLGWGIPEMLEALCRRLFQRQFWPEGWIAIRNILRQPGEKGGDLARLQALADDVAPRTLEHHVLAWGLFECWTLIHAEEGEGEQRSWDRLWQRIEQLGAELGRDPETFHRLLPRLVTAKQGSTFLLGRGLADTTTDPETLGTAILAALAALPPDLQNFNLMKGFLRTLRESRPNLTDAFLDQIALTPALVVGLPELQFTIGQDAPGLRRVIAAVRDGRIPTQRLRHLYLKSEDMGKTEPLLMELMAAVAALPDGGREAAAEILSWLVDDSNFPPSDRLKEFGREFLREWRFEQVHDRDLSHTLSRIVKGCLAGPEGAEGATALAQAITRAAAEHPIGCHDQPFLIRTLLETQPGAALDGFLLSQNRHGERLLLREYDADDADNPLKRVPESTLLSWADVDRGERYPILAGLVRLFDKDHAPSPLMLRLIEGVPEHGPVLAAMAGNLVLSGGVVSELVTIHESRAKGIEVLFTHSSPDVADWARRAAEWLRATAERRRRELGDRNERFE